MKPEDYRSRLAANIGALMLKRGLTAAELSRRANIGRTGIHDIMNGHSANPRVDTIQKIADALGVPLHDLLIGPEGDSATREIIEIMSRLPMEERRRLLVTARAWIDARESDKKS